MSLRSRYSGCATGAGALSLVEVMVAVIVLTVVVTGAVAFMTSGRTKVVWAGQHRVAAQIGMERIERARAVGYSSLDYDSVSTTVDGTQYDWQLSASEYLADPADSNSAYKRIEVNVSWTGTGDDSVTLHTAVSP